MVADKEVTNLEAEDTSPDEDIVFADEKLMKLNFKRFP